MAVCAEDIKQIKDIFDTRVKKIESQIENIKREIVDDIKELSHKFDGLAKDQTALAERIVKMETSTIVLEESRKEQGKRIGECEQKLAVIIGEGAGKEKSGTVARWVVPVVISAIGLAYTLIMAIIK